MLRNFDELKQQIDELSTVVNKFKSEAVQLRIVELVFGLDATDDEEDLPSGLQVGKKPVRHRKSKSRQKTNVGSKASPSPSAGTTKSKKTGARAVGAVGILNDLVAGEFFKSKKTINDIVTHSDQHLARKFKASAFSGTLARLTRNGVLKREKNSDGQYEYTK